MSAPSNGQLLIGNGTGYSSSTLTAGSNITVTNGAGTITISSSASGSGISTLSDDLGTSISPSSGNVQLIGHVNEQGSTKFSTVIAGTNSVNINPMSPARWIVDGLGGNGTHSTISSALSSANSGDTILILPGTYIENLTLKAGVNLTAFPCDGLFTALTDNTGNVTIVGKTSFTGLGSCCLSGLCLKTNSDYCLSVTGSSASEILMTECTLIGSNHNAIQFTSSSANANIFIQYSNTALTNSSCNLYDMTSPGSLSFYYVSQSQTGSASSNNSSGIVTQEYVNANTIMSTSGSGVLVFVYCDMDASTNTTLVTTSGSGTSEARFTHFSSGTASSLSIGAGTTFNAYHCDISSSNTNAITGSGIFTYECLTFSGGSYGNNVSTSLGGTLPGSIHNNPSGGFLGEQIRNYASGISISSGSQQNITSISLTAGVWDISIVATVVFSGSGTALYAGISNTSSTIQGNQADQYGQNQGTFTGGSATVTIPSWRLLLTSTSTYYLVAQPFFSNGTGTAYGRISATRVG